MNMNTRVLGALCIIGGAAYLITGLRFFVAGGPIEDLLGVVLSSIWALGGICGLLGMLAARVTGTNRVVRALSYLPVAAFLSALVGNVQRTLNPAIQFSPFIFFGLLGLVVGMLLVGVPLVVLFAFVSLFFSRDGDTDGDADWEETIRIFRRR